MCTDACICNTYDNSNAQEDKDLEADESNEAMKATMIQNDKITLTGWEIALYVYVSKLFILFIRMQKPNITANW